MMLCGWGEGVFDDVCVGCVGCVFEHMDICISIASGNLWLIYTN